MKKFVLLVVMPFVFLSASFGQITRDASDSIVLERMSLETRPHTVYAKTDTAAITTRAGELLELGYPCWIYYIHYCDQAEDSLAARRYLVVKESSGNVLEVRTKNDIAPPNYVAWRVVCGSISTTDYSIGTECTWDINNLQQDSVYVISSEEELLNFISCIEDSIPTYIDFDQYSLLFVHGGTSQDTSNIAKNLAFCFNQYNLNIDIHLNDKGVVPKWHIAVIVPKLTENSKVELTITYTMKTPCNCILDTLKGEWMWMAKKYGGIGGEISYNDFKSIVKILSLNEDASINYEVWVEDTLFSKGNFQIQKTQWGRRLIEIKLPHSIDDKWSITNEEIEIFLNFWDGLIDGGYTYHYVKLKE